MRNRQSRQTRDSKGSADPRSQFKALMETLTFSEWTMATSTDVDGSIATSIMAMIMLKFMNSMNTDENGGMVIDNATLRNVLQESTDLIKMYQKARTSNKDHETLTEFLLV